ncbi:hypothetical protein DID88_009942 [Monilinia fructigena]|uniref:cutinase n=1 Tax=Monilinia fructigena TaxID=38457 RepID=A0A395IL84_9HELO|nr:hypothetical protein DID88_009942 [Monilinia fructigena]
MKLSYFLTILTASLIAAAPIPSVSTTDNEKRNAPLNVLLSQILSHLPITSGAVRSIDKILLDFNNLISQLTGVSATYNELGGACKDYTIIFARGTDDNGNTGVYTGPPFFMALKNAVGSSNVTVQGVNNYAATMANYLAGGDPVGSASMASQINAAYAACPNTHLVASGFSQGGQIVHNALALLPAATAKWISSVVIFGDPYDGQAIPTLTRLKSTRYVMKVTISAKMEISYYYHISHIQEMQHQLLLLWLPREKSITLKGLSDISRNFDEI